MPNIAAVLKSEIARLARKEIKHETQALRKAAGAYRADIAGLKRRVHELEGDVRRLARAAAKTSKPEAVRADEAEASRRFSAKGFASLRQRLGISAADMGLLLGSSGLSVYKWERGEARPRAKYLAAIAAVRGIGKREASARLEALR